jgi:hypothetical protein
LPIVAPVDPHHSRQHSILHLLHHPKILNKHGRHQSGGGRNFQYPNWFPPSSQRKRLSARLNFCQELHKAVLHV